MFTSLYGSFKKWRKYRDTYSELSRLTRHELDDLGISRSDIDVIARRTAM